ncbi:hypothetical protein RND81_05G143100 [Saponaria officinalis]|uniref:Ubiquitin-like protease family profile domain-containing protein n=1 Tax=Saponaria officinalis TaxID=3572 RepID=A0AAW1L111_SAPOF
MTQMSQALTQLEKPLYLPIKSYAKMGEKCRKLHDMLKISYKSVELYNVKFPKELYHYSRDIDVPIVVEDIIQMFELKWLNISIIQVWGRYISEVGVSLGVDNVGYLCPERLSSVETDTLGTSEYITDALVSLQGKKFILGPYFESEHWMLIVICPERNEVYFMDPKKRCQTRSIKLKMPLNVAFRCYCQKGGKHDFKKGSSLTWPKTLCPQQPGGDECAYYVLKLMYEIVLSHTMKDELTKCFKESSYSSEEINEIRDLWSEYFKDSCMK